MVDRASSAGSLVGAALGLLAGVLQFVPHLGPVLGLIGPVLAATLHWKDWQHPAYVLILYALIAVGDGLLLQPIIMKRTSKVPLWASILVPLAFGFLLPFWGVLLAPPLLAVVFAYRDRWRTRTDRAHGG
jgi:predicted PurR-regulated permease PerM